MMTVGRIFAVALDSIPAQFRWIGWDEAKASPEEKPIFMKSEQMKQSVSVVLILVLIALPRVYAQQEPESGPAPQSAEQIQALVAPIALYPDALVAQVLSASTFPDQVAIAQNWLGEHKGVSGQQLMKDA